MLTLIKRNYIRLLKDIYSIVVCFFLPFILNIGLNFFWLKIQHSSLGERFYDELYFGPAENAINSYNLSLIFFSLFIASLIIRDKKSPFIQRIRMAPISYWTYILSYITCFLPIMIVQWGLNLCIGIFLGASTSPIHFLMSIIYFLPAIFIYISLGILLGEICKNQIIPSIIIALVFLLNILFLTATLLPLHLDEFQDTRLTKMALFFPFEHCAAIVRNIYIENSFTYFDQDIVHIIIYLILFWIGIITGHYWRVFRMNNPKK